MPADPFLQFADGFPRLSQSEVAPPASDVAVPLVTQLITRTTAASIPHLANLCLESLQAFRCYPDPLPAIQSEAQKLAFPDPPGSALGGIHLQSQVFLDPTLDGHQRPLRRRLTAYVDIAVIRISAEAVPAPLQFLIERIQIDIGQ
jgi:hypothetical protein